MSDRALPLKGRTALVTGAAKRIGRAVALALAEAGADVIVHYRGSGDEAEATASLIRQAGPRAWCVQADLADGEQAGSWPAPPRLPPGRWTYWSTTPRPSPPTP